MAPLATDRRNPPVKPISLCGKKFLPLFWNAACVAYHQQIYATPNRLLQSVQEDLNEIENTAGYRALGIIDKLPTGPSLHENVRQLKIHLN